MLAARKIAHSFRQGRRVLSSSNMAETRRRADLLFVIIG